MKSSQVPSACYARNEVGSVLLMNTASVSNGKASNESMTDLWVYDTGSSSSFEFPEEVRGAAVCSHLRFGPSKWEDAEKWLASSQCSNKPKNAPVHGHTSMNPPKQLACHMTKHDVPSSYGAFHMTKDNAPSVNPHGLEATLHHGPRVDTEGASNGTGEAHSFAFPAPPPKARSNNSFDFYPDTGEPYDMKEVSISREGVDVEPILKPAEPPAWDPPSYVMPAPVLRSVSMRDMGTEMTPIASQEPSQTGTPIQATTPTMSSPVSSGTSTPQREAPAPSPLQASEHPIQPSENAFIPDNDNRASESCAKDMQARTRKEIQSLGAQLGKVNIVAWASKEEEDGDSSKLLKNIDLEEVKKNVLETRAAAWEEAEQAKYMARFKREEAKIQAWENHEKAKAEAEMRRIEVKVEKIRSHAHEKLMNTLAAAKRRAEERRAVAEARRGEQAAKTAQHAHHIRRTGRVPSSFLACAFCQQ